MEREKAQIIEIPQLEPTGAEKILFWLLNRKKEVLFSALGLLVSVLSLAWMQTPSHTKTYELVGLFKQAREISQKGEMETLFAKLSASYPENELLSNLLQKMIFSPPFERTSSQIKISTKGWLGAFSEISILLSQGEQKEALKKSWELDKKLQTAPCALAQKLYPYHLFRLYNLLQKQGEKEQQQEVLGRLNSTLETPQGKDFAKSFEKKGISLKHELAKRNPSL